MTLEQIALILGLALPLGLAGWLARGVDPAGRVSPLPLWLGLLAPPVLLLVPFFTATTSARGDFDGFAVRMTHLSVGLLALVFAVLALRLHARETRSRPGRHLAVLASLLVALGAVHGFGLYFLARQSVVVDPAGGIADVVADSPGSYLLRLVAPSLALGLVVLVTSGAPWAVDRGTATASAVHRGTARLLRRPPAVTGPGSDGQAQRLLPLALGSVAVVLFVLPRVPGVGRVENGAYLTVVGGVRTPEIGLYVLVLALALLGSGDRTSPRSSRWYERSAGRWRVGLVGAAVLASLARSDLGAVIAVVAAHVAIRITVLRGVDADRLRAAHTRQTLRTHPVWRYRRTWLPGVLTSFVLVVLGSVALGKGERFEVWLDPWHAPLAAPAQACAYAPDLAPGDLLPAVDVPDGVKACIRYADEAPDAPSTQVALSQVVIEGGGLWGSSIADTRSGRVPVSESDFVVSAVWSKAGGISVLLLMGLFCVAGGALVRYVEPKPGRWASRTAHERTTVLAASGVAAVLVWQPLYVVASNLGLAPHAGVPMVLVSEGLWAAVSLVVAIGGVLVLAHWLPRETAEPIGIPTSAHHAARSVPASSAIAFVAAGCLVAWGLTFPLSSILSSESHLPDLDRGWDVTGVVALTSSREPDRLSVDGRPAFERRGSMWTRLDDGPDLKTLQEFVTTFGNGQGLLDDDLVELATPLRRGLRDRLRPPRTEPGRVIDLTVVVDLQSRVRELVRESVSGVRFATGLSVISARDGRVLALASAPQLADAADPSFDDVLADLNAGEEDRLDGETYRSLATGEPECDGHDCVRVSWEPDPERLWDRGTLPSYAGLSRTKATLQQNRAVTPEGAGSVFKVVIAAAYLRAGGQMTDLVDAPGQLYVDGRWIFNVYDSNACPGTTRGQQTVAMALATSCNTPFVLLAQQLGWDAVADEAERFGLSVTGRPTARCAPAGISSVPARTDASGIANLALGGGDLVVSPLSMAMVMGTIANDGVRAAPHAMEPTDGEADPCTQRVLSRFAAGELRSALRLTATDGSLVGVAGPEAPALHGKTGTHVLSARDGIGVEVDRTIWIAGFIDTEHGPVAFAVATQSIGTDPGRTHARALVGALVERISR